MQKKQHWYSSIRFKLIIPIALAFITLIGLNTVVLTRESIRSSEQILTELRSEIVKRVESTLDSKLEQAIKINEFHANSLNNKILDFDNVQNREGYFVAALKPFSDVAMTFIGLPDGSFYGARRLQDGTLQVVRNNALTSGNSEYYEINKQGNSTTLAQVFENFDARTRPWYQTALEKKELSFSSLYSHFVFKVPTVTASMPYYEGDQLVGVFGVDFLMTWLGETLSGLSVGENGSVFIVDSNDLLVASSTNDNIFKIVDEKAVNINASEAQSPIIRETIKRGFSDTQLASLDLDGRSYLIGRDPLNIYGIDWSIYTIIDKADYTTELSLAIRRMNIVGIIAILMFLFFIAYSNHKFAEPILALNTHAKMLTSGNFVNVKPFRHSPEMTELIKSFNEMGTRIQSYVVDLQHEVEKQTKMYEEAAVEAQNANVAKSRFLATMSHELRTPLTGILGMVELLKTTELSEEQTDYVNLAEHTSNTLLLVINGVLDYSKIEAQQVEIEHLPFEMIELRQDIESLAHLYVASKGLEFECGIDESIPSKLIGDRFRLRQILTNLVGNAVKFTKVGKITVNVECESIDYSREEVMLRFLVRDTGFGIPAEKQLALFEPFSQADVSTTREYGGTGLGLAICKELVELMNGVIKVDSVVGEGSTFIFTSKLGFRMVNNTKALEDSSNNEDFRDWAHQILNQSLQILLVEDSKVNYEYIQKIANKSNWTFTHAINGEVGIDLYVDLKEKLDVILMDIEMPIMDGHEVTRRIRAIERESGLNPVRIIGISANVLEGEREKCLGNGMDAYLSKPFRIEQLLAAMRNLK